MSKPQGSLTNHDGVVNDLGGFVGGDETRPSLRRHQAPKPRCRRIAKLSFERNLSTSKPDELSRPVASLERALKGLNLGVACWTVFAEWGDGYDFLRQYVGYAQVNGDWCIAIQTSQGQESRPEESHDDIWKFSESPLHLRIKAIDKLPDLVEALVKTADATADRLKKKVEPAQDLADAVNTFLHRGVGEAEA